MLVYIIQDRILHITPGNGITARGGAFGSSLFGTIGK